MDLDYLVVNFFHPRDFCESGEQSFFYRSCTCSICISGQVFSIYWRRINTIYKSWKKTYISTKNIESPAFFSDLPCELFDQFMVFQRSWNSLLEYLVWERCAGAWVACVIYNRMNKLKNLWNNLITIKNRDSLRAIFFYLH